MASWELEGSSAPFGPLYVCEAWKDSWWLEPFQSLHAHERGKRTGTRSQLEKRFANKICSIQTVLLLQYKELICVCHSPRNHLWFNPWSPMLKFPAVPKDGTSLSFFPCSEDNRNRRRQEREPAITIHRSATQALFLLKSALRPCQNHRKNTDNAPWCCPLHFPYRLEKRDFRCKTQLYFAGVFNC